MHVLRIGHFGLSTHATIMAAHQRIAHTDRARKTRYRGAILGAAGSSVPRDGLHSSGQGRFWQRSDRIDPYISVIVEGSAGPARGTRRAIGHDRHDHRANAVKSIDPSSLPLGGERHDPAHGCIRFACRSCFVLATGTRKLPAQSVQNARDTFK